MSVSDLKAEIKEAIVEGLKLKREPGSIGDADPFFGGGLNLDSVDILTLVTVLEDRFGLRIQDDEVPKLNSVDSVADFVAAKRQAG